MQHAFGLDEVGGEGREGCLSELLLQGRSSLVCGVVSANGRNSCMGPKAADMPSLGRQVASGVGCVVVGIIFPCIIVTFIVFAEEIKRTAINNLINAVTLKTGTQREPRIVSLAVKGWDN